jgi:hypothetical protein
LIVWTRGEEAIGGSKLLEIGHRAVRQRRFAAKEAERLDCPLGVEWGQTRTPEVAIGTGIPLEAIQPLELLRPISRSNAESPENAKCPIGLTEKGVFEAVGIVVREACR